jgi:hypothetical protein
MILVSGEGSGIILKQAAIFTKIRGGRAQHFSKHSPAVD